MQNICDVIRPGTAAVIGFVSDSVPDTGPIQVYLNEIPWENVFEINASDSIRAEIARLLSEHSHSDWLFALQIAENGDIEIHADAMKDKQEAFLLPEQDSQEVLL